MAAPEDRKHGVSKAGLKVSYFTRSRFDQDLLQVLRDGIRSFGLRQTKLGGSRLRQREPARFRPGLLNFRGFRLRRRETGGSGPCQKEIDLRAVTKKLGAS